MIGSDPAFVTAMVEGNAGPTAAALARVQPQLDQPVAGAGRRRARRPHAGRPAGATSGVPLDRAALLALGRAGGAVTRRLAAFLEGWVPEG